MNETGATEITLGFRRYVNHLVARLEQGWDLTVENPGILRMVHDRGNDDPHGGSLEPLDVVAVQRTAGI